MTAMTSATTSTPRPFFFWLQNLCNEPFYKLLYKCLAIFATTTKLQQPKVTLQLLDKWRTKSPGGPFLKFDSQKRVWKDVGDKKAQEQIAKAFWYLLKNKAQQQEQTGNLTTAQRTIIMEEDSPALLRAVRLSSLLVLERKGSVSQVSTSECKS